jgi:hypothetical protein
MAPNAPLVPLVAGRSAREPAPPPCLGDGRSPKPPAPFGEGREGRSTEPNPPPPDAGGDACPPSAGRSTSKLNAGGGAGAGAAGTAAAVLCACPPYFGPAGRLTAAGRPTSPASAGRSRSSRPGSDDGAICGGAGTNAGAAFGATLGAATAGSARPSSKSKAGIIGGGAATGDAAGFDGIGGGLPPAPKAPTPTIVCFIFGRSAGAAPGAAGAAPAPFDGSVTRKVCPHLGQRILRPVCGTRRSST